MQLSMPKPDVAAADIMEKWLCANNPPLDYSRACERGRTMGLTCSEVNMTRGPGSDCRPSVFTRGYFL